jgi:hypothetical protein
MPLRLRSWMYVQNRKYETGRNLNRLAFGLIDEKGNACTSGSDAPNAQLFAPDGSAVNLLKYRFDCDVEIFGIYDAVTSRWDYSDSWQFDSWFRADFFETLIPGQYRLQVTLADGQVVESRFEFKKTAQTEDNHAAVGVGCGNDNGDQGHHAGLFLF